ncbi:hypothetical protein C8R46DRAFT_51055 [Mycena filopes]|nr:hypothetical protein C8R46DRAFT_51055 [Mycena filopes]
MSDPSKASGNAKNAKGTVTEAIGDMTGSDSWKTSGQKDQAAGKGEVKAAETQGYVQGAMDSVTGMAKQAISTVTGDSTQNAEGKAQDTKGQAKRAANS